MDHLRSKYLAQETVGIVHLYFRYDDEKQQTVKEMTGSILQQLVQRRGAVDSDIKAIYDSYTAKDIKPTTNAYVGLIEKQMEKLERFFLVVDALDECPENKRREFFRVLNRLPPMVNIFLTSRDDTKVYPYITREIQELVIRASDDDVKNYVQSRLEEEIDSPRLGYHLLEQPSLREDIVRDVAQKADGMHVSHSEKHLFPS